MKQFYLRCTSAILVFLLVFSLSACGSAAQPMASEATSFSSLEDLLSYVSEDATIKNEMQEHPFMQGGKARNAGGTTLIAPDTAIMSAEFDATLEEATISGDFIYYSFSVDNDMSQARSGSWVDALPDNTVVRELNERAAAEREALMADTQDSAEAAIQQEQELLSEAIGEAIPEDEAQTEAFPEEVPESTEAVSAEVTEPVTEEPPEEVVEQTAAEQELSALYAEWDGDMDGFVRTYGYTDYDREQIKGMLSTISIGWKYVGDGEEVLTNFMYSNPVDYWEDHPGYYNTLITYYGLDEVLGYMIYWAKDGYFFQASVPANYLDAFWANQESLINNLIV